MDYFDFSTATTGRYGTAPLSDSAGAAQYYSSQNPKLNAAPHNKNIPAANGYPYTVTRYTPDATGRIMMQSGVGDSMQMGGRHATRYYYGSASQEELDALFGTEAGNYTHYFKNMVQDANEQMSVSYVDMHGRTVATALTGEAPESMLALDISAAGQYKNQAGTTLTRNLLDDNTNVLKGNAIESVNTILVPFRTPYSFSYQFPVRTLQLPDCSGGTVSYTCKYDLQIAITEESGDTAAIVFNYPGIEAIDFQESVVLPVGSYSIRKTLSINEDSLAAFMQQYNTAGVGLCRTLQFLTDSIAAQDSIASNCGLPATPLTCSNCLSSLGSYDAYLLNYISSIGLSDTAQLTDAQEADIRHQYVNDSSFCTSLNSGTSHSLDNIKKQMLADMVPYSGQYARKEGVNQSMFYKYDIFSASGNPEYPQPFYKNPRNQLLQNDHYYDAYGRTDSSVLGTLLNTMTKNEFQQAFKSSWAASLLPYHPEFAKLKFAEDSLRATYDFIDSVNQTVDIAFNPLTWDPFFNVISTDDDKDSITRYSNVSWHGGYSMWQMAYGDAFGCKTPWDAFDRETCYNSMPKELAATGTIVNTSSGSLTLTPAIQQQAWSEYRAFYSQARGEMVNKYINVHASAADNDDLISQGYRIYFPNGNVQQAENLGWTDWFPQADGTLPVINLADSAAQYRPSCESYINSWRQALLQCPALPGDSATKEQIIHDITSRMAEVCRKGTDGANPYGASTVAPAYAGDTLNSFEAVVYHVFDSLHIAPDLYCHPYGIEFPKPHGSNPIVTKQYVAAVDTCTCSQFGNLKAEVASAGFNNMNLDSINAYLWSTYQDTISTVLYEGLQRCGQSFLKCKLIPGPDSCYDKETGLTVPCSPPPQYECETLYIQPLPIAQPLPFFLHCGFTGAANSCFSCADFKLLDSSFYAIFGRHPVFNGSIDDDTVLNYNNLFAKYVNFKTGLQHNWLYYAEQFRTRECGIGGLTGTSDTLKICLDRTPLNDTAGFVQTIPPCQQARDRAALKAALLYDASQQELQSAFRQAYIAACTNTNELFSIVYSVKEYHYTLYYYDQAGNLIKTVPPKGVIPIFRQSFLDSVAVARSNGTLLTPQHELVTRYCYNSLNQVNIQKTPDGGTSRFWYDRLGRLAVSQNARQLQQGNVYSYTFYDELGRITEVGQLTGGTAMSDATARSAANLNTWLNNATATRNQITKTVYDEVYPAINGVVLSQQHLRNRVSYTQVINSASDTYPASATYYSYDVHGNVDTLLQDFGNSTGVTNMMNSSGNRFKRVVYDYDLISGKVNTVAYQPGYFDVALQTWVSPTDRYYHRYAYDADNRLTDVYSGKDSVMLLLFPEREAHYSYYQHGPLARTELGQLKVQGLDYVYTLQGWLKGVNPVRGGTLANGTDTAESFPTARDAYGFSLHYYNHDYTAIGYTPAGSSVLSSLPNGGSPLFNGNIAAMAVNLPNMGGAKVYHYQYDQLNRLVAMDVYDGLSSETGSFSPILLDDYRERIAYDPNGNILRYQRNGDAARHAMDSLTYFYTAGTNRLHKVSDGAPDADGGTYTQYNDIRQGQNDNNYAYDAIGNLIRDEAEGITSIDWNVYGKIRGITKSSGTIRYSYDAQGNRVIKQAGRDTTAYVRDASGNVLAVYTHRGDAGVVQVERHLYGSSRIGVAGYSAAVDTVEVLSGGFGNAIKSTFTRGRKLFELTNHLGNVLATVSDKRLQVNNDSDGDVDDYAPDVVTANDYYPFGMLMPGRSGHQGRGGSGWINGSGASGPEQGLPSDLLLDDPRTGSTPSEYVATDHIDIIPDFESQANDDFTVYIDNSGGSGDSGGSGGSGSSGAGGASNGYYRYGFNGKENDNEVKGSGAQYDYGFRIYDSRIGRFLSTDPLTQSYPWYTPYQYAGNKPTWCIDLDGLEEALPKQPAKIPQLTNASESTCIGCADRAMIIHLRQAQANLEKLRKEYETWVRDPDNLGKPLPPQFEKVAVQSQGTSTIQQGGYLGSNEYKLRKANYDTYGQYLPGPSDLVDGLNAIGELSNGNYTSAAVSAFFLIPGADVFKPIRALKGAGGELLEGYLKKFSNQADHLTKLDIQGALKDIANTPILKKNGIAWQHLKEVEEALSGVGNQLDKLTKDINAGKFTDEVLKQAETIRGTLQKQKDKLTDVLNEAKKNAQ